MRYAFIVAGTECAVKEQIAMGYADDYEKAMEKSEEHLLARSQRVKQNGAFSNVPTDQAFLNQLNKQIEERMLNEIMTRNRTAVQFAQKRSQKGKDKAEESLNHFLRKRKKCRLPSPTNKTEWISVSKAIDLIRNGADAYKTGIGGVCYILTKENEIFYFHCSSVYRKKIIFTQI